MCSTTGLQTSLWRGCPIRILRVLRLYAAPPERFAGLRVLLRLQAPRHPPRTLLSVCSLHLLEMSSSVSTHAALFASAKLKVSLLRLFMCKRFGLNRSRLGRRGKLDY
jgi:hypothetical protein